MKRSRIAALFILAAVSVLLAAVPVLLAADGPPVAPPSSPRLVVIIVVDQLPAEHFAGFADLYGEGGFRRLITDGAWFTNCHFDHGVTITGPGHATIVTGAAPEVHGIVGNYFMEYPPLGGSGTGGQPFPLEWHRKVACVDDPSFPVIGAPGDARSVPLVTAGGRQIPAGGVSPRWLPCLTLGDQIKARSSRARVVSCSLKARAAVLMGGHDADGVFWWEYTPQDSAFVTSSYYGASPPSWLVELNARQPAKRWIGQHWTRLLAQEVYERRCGADVVDHELGSALGVGNGFPHPYASSSDPYRAIMTSPAGNELVLELARTMIEVYALGQDPLCDLLCISLSSNDEVGHAYGPQSHEFMDITLRTDQQLAGFLQELDTRIGLQHCMIALTSDHGAVPMPESSRQQGRDAGRFDPVEIGQRFEARLAEAAGSSPEGRPYVQLVQMPWMYLDEPLLAERGVDSPKLRAVLDGFVEAEPGLAAAFLGHDIAKSDFVRDDLTRRVRHSYYPRRSGQVYLHITRYWHSDLHETGHGSAHDYDTHVPLLLYGPGIKPGRYDAPATPADLVPTLAHLLRVLRVEPPKGATGRVLVEALQPATTQDSLNREGG